MPPIRPRTFLSSHPRNLLSTPPPLPKDPADDRIEEPAVKGAASAPLTAPPLPAGHGRRPADLFNTGGLKSAWKSYLAARGGAQEQKLGQDRLARLLRLLLEHNAAWPQIHMLLRIELAAGQALPRPIFRQALDRATRAGDLVLARQLCESRSGQAPTIEDYEFMLLGLAATHPLPAWAVLGDMVQHGLSPTLEAYRILLFGRVGAGALDEAEEVLNLIEGAALQPAPGVYSCLVYAYARAGRPERAHALLLRMRLRGVPPWRPAYNVAIAAGVRQGRLAQALELYADLLRSGLSPDRATLLPLLQAAQTAHQGPLHAALMSQARDHQVQF